MIRLRWSNVATVFVRELRDQLRDRRTLFMIIVLPILLYPMLGVGLTKFSKFLVDQPKRVLVVGAESLPRSPALLAPDGTGFAPELFDNPADAAKLLVTTVPESSPLIEEAARRRALREGTADVLVVIPPDVAEQIKNLGRSDIPVFYDGVDEKSQFASLRVEKVLENWTRSILKERLRADQKPETYTEPVRARTLDVAQPGESGGNVWAKLFPFLLVMMALTGAFYPAVDGCAGEKERGTMETLLISPATRSEIVLGKFLMVWLASIATALLNLLSMGLTAWHLATSVGALAGRSAAASGRAMSLITAPSIQTSLWMVLLLVPLAAFFSAISLALAVMARSMKEGQYYLTPVYLVVMPLVFLTLAPGIELDLFTSLVPVTGVSLLLRTLMQGDYRTSLTYFLPVMVPLLLTSALALRWAVDQFQRESVLFRESERFDLFGWLRHLHRDKEALPGSGAAVFCFSVMISAAWFVSFALGGASYWQLVVGQALIVLGPPVALALFLCARPLEALRFRRARWRDLALGGILAVAINPLANELRFLVERLFPVDRDLAAQLESMLGTIPNLGVALVILAVVPAICEEIAFRGFILTGLERDYSPRWAVIISALLFGFLHVLLSLFQQLFNATLLGIVIGLLAVRSRSIWPGIVFHITNNALVLLLSAIATDQAYRPLAPVLFRDPAQGLYHSYWVLPAALLAVIIIGVIYLKRPAAVTPPLQPDPFLAESAA